MPEPTKNRENFNKVGHEIPQILWVINPSVVITSLRDSRLLRLKSLSKMSKLTEKLRLGGIAKVPGWFNVSAAARKLYSRKSKSVITAVITIKIANRGLKLKFISIKVEWNHRDTS